MLVYQAPVECTQDPRYRDVTLFWSVLTTTETDKRFSITSWQTRTVQIIKVNYIFSIENPIFIIWFPDFKLFSFITFHNILIKNILHYLLSEYQRGLQQEDKICSGQIEKVRQRRQEGESGEENTDEVIRNKTYQWAPKTLFSGRTSCWWTVRCTCTMRTRAEW